MERYPAKKWFGTVRLASRQPKRRKRWFARRQLLSALFGLALLLEPTARAGNYSIDWFTSAGGAGMSRGGAYSMSGTIGQPDAAWMSGGTFTLEGGFWGIMGAIQTPGAPLLSITRTNSNIIVSWPAPADGWVLEQTNRVMGLSGPWPQMLFSYVTNAKDIRVTMPVTPGNLFFRLFKP